MFFVLSPLVPADGVKGKTWGPSTLHQRERGAIISQPPNPASPGGKRWSRSAPDLEKTPLRTALLANAHRSPHLQEIGNPTSKKLYSSANNLIDDQATNNAACDIPQNSEFIEPNLDDIEIIELDASLNSREFDNNSKESIISKEFNRSRHSSGKKSSRDDSTNFVHSVASTLVGTAKRVKKRDRSKSKESKRRDSSESRLNSLAEFFRSPSGSRKGSLNSHSAERKSSITVRVNDVDGLESSPENSIGKKRCHKSRVSKSPLRVFSKMRAWGSKDTLDDKTSAKVEYSVLDDSIMFSKHENFEIDLGCSTPRFLTANSREGVDFECLEAALCNLDNDHSNDSFKSKNSLSLFDKKLNPVSSNQGTLLHHSSTWSNYEDFQIRDNSEDDKPLLSQKFKSSDNLCDYERNANVSLKRPEAIKDFDRKKSEPKNFNSEIIGDSLNFPRRSSEGSNSTSPNFQNTQRFFRTNNK